MAQVQSRAAEALRRARGLTGYPFKPINFAYLNLLIALQAGEENGLRAALQVVAEHDLHRDAGSLRRMMTFVLPLLGDKQIAMLVVTLFEVPSDHLKMLGEAR